MDGIETARRIRETGTEYARNLPIIALTANSLAGNREKFLNNGFQDFLPKPIDISRLDDIIRNWVRDKEKEKMFISEEPDAAEGDEIRTKIPSIQIAGLDTVKGIERFGGDEESYLDVLSSYVVNTLPLLDTIADVSMETLEDYAIIVHGINGSSRGVFANLVSELAKDLEKAAKEKDLDFVIRNNAAFIKSVRGFIAKIDEALSNINAETTKKKKDKPDRGLLLKLAAACDEYDINEADGIISELERFDYDSGNELIAWLKENVEDGYLEEIKEKIKNGNFTPQDYSG
jgi:CheY-like chemotaxis protein